MDASTRHPKCFSSMAEGFSLGACEEGESEADSNEMEQTRNSGLARVPRSPGAKSPPGRQAHTERFPRRGLRTYRKHASSNRLALSGQACCKCPCLAGDFHSGDGASDSKRNCSRRADSGRTPRRQAPGSRLAAGKKAPESRILFLSCANSPRGIRNSHLVSAYSQFVTEYNTLIDPACAAHLDMGTLALQYA